MEIGIITISDNKNDFTKEKVNDSAQMRYLMFQRLSSCVVSNLVSSLMQVSLNVCSLRLDN